MAFVNEKIPDEDKAKVYTVINYENLKTQAQWIPWFSEPSRWVIDRERNVYIIFVVGGGRDQYPYYALGIDGQAVVFNVNDKSTGGERLGIQEYLEIYDLKIPINLESRKEEIKQFIREGLEELAYFRPLADGGTFANPNTVARGNIISFEIEFK